MGQNPPSCETSLQATRESHSKWKNISGQQRLSIMFDTGKLQVARLKAKMKGKKSEYGYQRQQTAGEITLAKLIQPGGKTDKQRTS